MTWRVLTTPACEPDFQALRHEGFASDDGPFAGAAYTWAQLLYILTRYAETGAQGPLFVRAG